MANFEFTTNEMSLITRALSDSMNYKPNDRFDEKWALLLRCKREQLELENTNAKTLEENINKPVMDIQESNTTEKLTPLEIVQGVFRLIGYLVLGFLGYNGVLAFAAVIGYAMVVLFEKLFNSLLNSTALMETLQGLFNWGCAHPTFSLMVLIVAYIAGFCWFVYKFAKNISDNLTEQLKE